jgi:hypothetical protein
MAYLNVRERRIEAKIAYVGPELAGRTTNFERLRQASGDARLGKVEARAPGILSIAIPRSADGRFRDCDLVVDVVAPQGPVTPEALSDADGVVIVVDASPTALARNRASIAAVRGALEKRDAVPVVLQVNKTDFPGALPSEALRRELDAVAMRSVDACATTGAGVIETLDAALQAVLAAMQEERAAAGAASTTGTQDTAGGGHPLLAALKQVLREAVRAEVSALEVRMAARLDARIAAHTEQLNAMNEGLNEALEDLKKRRRWFT